MKYYLINHASRAAAYGIGTYINNLLQCLKGIPAVEPVLIDISADVDEFSVTETDGVEHLIIPLNNKPYGGELYAHAMVNLLAEYLPTEGRCVFHFNYFQHYDLARLLKSRYPHSHLIFAIHYFGWCFTLNGNVTRFRNIVQKNEIVEEMDRGVLQGYRDDTRFFALCDKVIALSSFTANLLVTDYGVVSEKICLVYNGVGCSEQAFYKKPLRSPNQKEILFVGRLDYCKGTDYILKSFRKILEHGINAHLTLVGDGDFNKYLSLCNGIWDKVTFTGRVNKEQLALLYQQATIAVLPSFCEQCSYSAIEIMSYKIPLIATDTTGLYEMLDYTPECRIHIDEISFNEDEFISELVSRTEWLFNDANRCAEVSEQQNRLFHERYTLDCMQKSMSDICAAIGDDASVSDAFYPYLDSKMIGLINSYMDIDADVKGLAGIGCYMWCRIGEFNRKGDKAGVFSSYMLQEHMIYYVDWVYDTLSKEREYGRILEDGSLLYVLYQLLEAGFYKTKVQSIIELLPTKEYLGHKERFALSVKADKEIIINNALNIYNTYFHS